MEIDRRSFWVHWAQLAEMLLPRRYRWFVTPNQMNRGSQVNQAIVDETGVIAARTCSSGMMAGLTSPTRPWFRLGLHDLADIPPGPVKNWLAEVERRMMRVLGESNFYQSLGVMYHDLSVFCSASMLIYDDPDQVIRCYNPCLGEFYFGLGPTNAVDTHARKFPLTIKAAVQQFGLKALPESVREAYKQGGTQLTNEIIICHVIEPNATLWAQGSAEMAYVVPKSFKYREAYWVEASGGNDLLISLAGYREKPFVGARWSTTSNDAYGSAGPGMDALPACRQLQIEQRRKAEAIDKLVRPPMVGSVSMKNEPASILPGAVTYVADLQGAGFKPAYQVDPRIQELAGDIQEVQRRIKDVFYVDLFMMVSSLDTVRTATEIDARREEKLIQLGPVIERFENEVLDPIIDRVFAIMARKGLFPPAPEGLSGEIDVQYISMLAEAATATATSSLERMLQLAGNLVAVQPDIMDNIDTDVTIEVYADYIKANPRTIRSREDVDAIRAARAKEQQAAMAAEATAGLVGAGKTLSETQLGGGQNALDAVLGNA
jgi:hypothetical protein